VSFSSASPETFSTIIYFLPSTIATDAPLYVVQKKNYEASKAKENNGAEDDAVEISNPGIAFGTQPRWGGENSQPGVAEKPRRKPGTQSR
jgi:hypothetical protein